ncbi:hypothetical protein X975_10332, partial [Stegodyphus mimosarum]
MTDKCDYHSSFNNDQRRALPSVIRSHASKMMAMIAMKFQDTEVMTGQSSSDSYPQLQNHAASTACVNRLC